MNSPVDALPTAELSVPAIAGNAPEPKAGKKKAGWLALIDSDALQADTDRARLQVADPVRFIPYAVLHLGCVGVIWAGWSWTAVIVALALYWGRMFAITGIYHRYFSHRTFRTSRPMQFILALWGNSAAQRGPIWWACQHRQHHQHSDKEPDAHSPVQHGLYWSHFGWLTAKDNLALNEKYVRDWMKFPELRFLDRFDAIVPIALATLLYGFGELLAWLAPSLGTSGFQMVVWGFFISTVALFHCTCLINSLAHAWGQRRFETHDDSRNNLLLALITMGEGWHNNHHRYSGSARQGFYWWEIDVTYYFLKLLSLVGVIWDLRPVPASVLEAGRRPRAATS